MIEIICSLSSTKKTFVTAQVSEAMRMFWRELMQAIAELHQLFALLYLSSTEDDNTYLKELEKALPKKKGGLPTVEADSVLDILTFTSYDI